MSLRSLRTGPKSLLTVKTCSDDYLPIDLMLRVLYRLRFLSEQHPLDITSFQYSLPLALEVFQVANLSEKQRADAEEKITLALEFVSYQSALCTSSINVN